MTEIYLKEFDRVCKGYLNDESNNMFYSISNTMFNNLKDFLTRLEFKEEVEVNLDFSPTSRIASVIIKVSNIRKSITSEQVFKLLTEFKTNFSRTLSTSIKIVENDEVSNQENELYDFSHNTVNYPEVEIFERNLGKVYERLVEDGDFISNKNPNIKISYDVQKQEIIKEYYGFYGVDEDRGISDTQKIVSKYLSRNLEFISNQFDSKVEGKLREKEDMTRYYKIFEDITKIKEYFTSIEGILKSHFGIYFGETYRLKVSGKNNKVGLYIEVRGVGELTSYFKTRQFVKEFVKLNIRYIDVHLIVKDEGLDDLLREHLGIKTYLDTNNKDTYYTSLKYRKKSTEEELGFISDVNELISMNLNLSKTISKETGGELYLDITQHEEDVNVSKKIWGSGELMLHNNKEVKMLLDIGELESKFNENGLIVEDLNNRYNVDNMQAIYNYFFK